MKRIFALGLAALALATTGCLQLESAAVIDKDGSGTLDITYTVPLDVEEAIKELSTLDAGKDQDMGMPPLFDDGFDISEMKSELTPLGVKVKDYTNGVENGSRVIRMSLAFDDIDGLQAALENAGGSDSAMGLRRLPDGNYYFGEVETAGTYDEEEDDYEEVMPDMDDMEDMEDMGAAMKNVARSMELMGVLMSRADEMIISWRITVPGDIIRHNAQQVEGRTCVWKLDSSGMMSGDMDAPEIVFSGEGLKIKAPEK